MGVFEQVYKRLPWQAQNLAISLYGYIWQKRRFGGVFPAHVGQFKERETLTSSEWENYQTTVLRKILVHAFEQVPFYRHKYSEAGFTAKDLAQFKLPDLKELPFLEKEELRAFGETELIAQNADPKGDFFSSSGSTGTPVRIYISRKMHQVWTAGFEVRIRNWAGVNRAMRRGMIGGRRVLPEGKGNAPYYRYNSFEKMVYYSAYHISKETAPDYVKGMRKHQVDYMNGYAMSNFFLANFINELQLDAPKLKAVLTSSEKLTPEMRETFRKAYGCETFDAWSGVEACALVSECEAHSLHESPDIGIIELLDNNGNLIVGAGAGEAVCTGLLNFDQPLIRYRCGDVLKASEYSCSCGRQMRTYKEIIGRLEDVVTGPDGRKMVRFHGIFIDLPSIAQGQIIQQKQDRFQIKVVCNNHLDPVDAQKIKQRMHSQLGEVTVDILEVNAIPKGANGKFKAVISNLS